MLTAWQCLARICASKTCQATEPVILPTCGGGGSVSGIISLSHPETIVTLKVRINFYFQVRVTIVITEPCSSNADCHLPSHPICEQKTKEGLKTCEEVTTCKEECEDNEFCSAEDICKKREKPRGNFSYFSNEKKIPFPPSQFPVWVILTALKEKAAGRFVKSHLRAVRSLVRSLTRACVRMTVKKDNTAVATMSARMVITPL